MPPPPEPAAGDAAALAVRRVLRHVLLLNGLIVAVKIAVGVHTHALAVLGAALESGLDLLNNVIGMTLVSIAARGPDEDHPYGHAKFETLGTIGIVMFLSISCFELLRQSLAAMIRGRALHSASGAEIAMLAGTLALNAAIVWYERRRGRALQSAFLMADAAHTATDVFVTLLALASLLLTRAGAAHVDAALGVAVALVIAWTGWQILRESVPILVDARGMDAEELRRLAVSIPGIRGVRTVRSRATASGQMFVEMTIVVAGASSVQQAHALADAVEQAVERAAGSAEVVVHVEPG
ncbi:MAG TPA: cation diffusion facilitator family transporter [Gemmatimonadaceae bacterium]|nr:cation diffusion facilitator family transporter [Gemmatimonadaceae bacterium]